jgi:hypothetical protein
MQQQYRGERPAMRGPLDRRLVPAMPLPRGPRTPVASRGHELAPLGFGRLGRGWLGLRRNGDGGASWNSVGGRSMAEGD